ncbi:hypothetical protein [Chthonomonas calidirosea]|uniref:hypothetical protein n=1 Tax=Chthonomonas calidirosea TaxID=454171 RepID=UPI0006EC8788|nr:hypothetical protein [Chthonomonas calidirosea]CEK17198.1 hypothetical protein CP488_01770 [Chthonomonas calidirosea]
MQTYAELLIEEAWFYSHNPLLGLAYLYDAPYSSDVPRLNTKKVLQTLLEETAGPKAMAVYHQAEAHNWNGPVPKVELVDPQKLGLLLGVLAGYYDFL